MAKPQAAESSKSEVPVHYDLDVAARILGVHRDTLRTEALKGKFGAFKVGRVWKFPRERIQRGQP